MQMGPLTLNRNSKILIEEETAILQFTLANLPTDPLQHILSNLNADDIVNINLVSHGFFKHAHNPFLWKIFLKKYFPYVESTKNSEYHQNPRALFLTEYTQVKNLLLHFKLPMKTVVPFILAALSGQIEKINGKELKEETLQVFYVLAGSNGHLALLQKATLETKQRSLFIAARNGNLVIVKALLAFYPELIDDIGKILLASAQAGQLKIVQKLLKICKHITNEHKGLALIGAVEAGHVIVVREIVKTCLHISNIIKNLALPKAAKAGDFNVLQELLDTCPGISDSAKGHALIDAATAGCLTMVQELLDKCPLISNGDKGKALISGVKSHHHNHILIVQELLAHPSCQLIDKKDKVSALHLAAELNLHEVVNTMLIAPSCACICENDIKRALTFANFRKNTVIVNILQKRLDAKPLESVIELYTPSLLVNNLARRDAPTAQDNVERTTFRKSQ